MRSSASLVRLLPDPGGVLEIWPEAIASRVASLPNDLSGRYAEEPPARRIAVRCDRCGRDAAAVQIYPPGAIPEGALDRLPAYLVAMTLPTLRVSYSGPDSGGGADPVDPARHDGVRALLAMEIQPKPRDAIATCLGDLYDDAGYCTPCSSTYCDRCWQISSTGFGTCPHGHGKSLDPHWSYE
jgi:hypothetical protein